MSMLLIFAGLISIIGIYSVAALALNLQFGVGGMINFGVAAFFGFGAYGYALAVMAPAQGSYTYILGLELPWWLAALIGGLVAAALAVVVGFAALRIGGMYFAVVTFAAAEVFRNLFMNEADLANGARGLLSVPVPGSNIISGRELPLFIAGLVVVIAVASFFIFRQVTRSAFGRSLLAVSQNEAVARSLGINVYMTKVKAFVFSAFFMGLAGVMYVWHLSILTPLTVFNVHLTFTVFIALIIGGKGNNLGAVVGATILLGLREGLNYLKLDWIQPEQLSLIQDIVLGTTLVVILLFWQQGIVRARSAKYENPQAHVSSSSATPAATIGESR